MSDLRQVLAACERYDRRDARFREIKARLADIERRLRSGELADEDADIELAAVDAAAQQLGAEIADERDGRFWEVHEGEDD